MKLRTLIAILSLSFIAETPAFAETKVRDLKDSEISSVMPIFNRLQVREKMEGVCGTSELTLESRQTGSAPAQWVALLGEHEEELLDSEISVVLNIFDAYGVSETKEGITYLSKAKVMEKSCGFSASSWTLEF